MGDEQRLGYEELLAAAREGFETGTDFTVAVEEEFALLDPATLGLVNRFEEVQAAAQGTALEPNLVGELIASEVEVKTGRCETFADIPAAMAERRAQLQALVDPLGIALGATGTHPWSPWQEQRIIDTPHYRRNDELLRYVVWRNNTFGLHVHVGIRGADRAIAVTNGLRNLLPELLALSASSPFVENVNTGLHSARTQIFTRFFPRCGVPGRVRVVAGVRGLRPLPLRDRLGHRAHAALVERPAAPRVPDGRDPDLRRAARPRGGAGAGRARHRARRADRTRLRRGRAARRPAAPADRGEHVARDPLRASRATSSTSSAATCCRTRARLERLLEWVAPVAEEIGAAPYLALPEQNAAERQIARFEEGATLEEIYAEQASGCRSVADEQVSEEAAARGAPAAQGLRPARADALDRFLARLSPAVRGAPRSRAGAARDRGAARARSRCSPARCRRSSLRDFEQVTANLQLAYAAAVAPAS